MKPYTVEYYKEINKIEEDQAVALSKILKKLYSPKSVVDLGCGTGLYLSKFEGEKLGIDVSESAFDKEVVKLREDEFRLGDLSEAGFVLPKKYDMALCLEVVEHIGCEYSDVVVENISRASDLVVMTAAPPGQAGLNHVTCEPQEYWNEIFGRFGFKRDYHDEFQIVYFVDQTPHSTWIIRNLMVYKRK